MSAEEDAKANGTAETDENTNTNTNTGTDENNNEDENNNNENNDEKISQFKNAEDEDLVIESDSDDENDQIVNLGKQNLTEIPQMIAKSKGPQATTLILTNNKLENLKNLDYFPNLETLQLDRNGLRSVSDLPKLSYLKTLWLNNNDLNDFGKLLNVLKKQCPKLEYLSLLRNPLCPDIYFEDSNESRYTRYRHTVLYNMPHLTFLDTTEVSIEERQEAEKRGKYLKIAKPDAQQMDDVADTADENEDEATDSTPYKQVEPAAFLGKGRIKYDGRESEGNRFILNNDL